MVIAQITDTHIKPEGVLSYGRLDTTPYLRRAVEHLLSLTPRPDVVLATGDLVDAGLPEEYRRLRDLLAPLPMPVYLIPGNHDNRDALASVFTDHAYLPRGGRFMQYVVEGHPVRLIALDTLDLGRIAPEESSSSAPRTSRTSSPRRISPPASRTSAANWRATAAKSTIPVFGEWSAATPVEAIRVAIFAA